MEVSQKWFNSVRVSLVNSTTFSQTNFKEDIISLLKLSFHITHYGNYFVRLHFLALLASPFYHNKYLNIVTHFSLRNIMFCWLASNFDSCQHFLLFSFIRIKLSTLNMTKRWAETLISSNKKSTYFVYRSQKHSRMQCTPRMFTCYS